MHTVVIIKSFGSNKMKILDNIVLKGDIQNVLKVEFWHHIKRVEYLKLK